MAERKHWAQSTADPVDGAPPGVLPISLDALNHLGVDGDGNLYWRDTQVMTVKKEIKLSVAQWIVAGLTVFAAVVGASAAAVSAYTDLMNYKAARAEVVKK
jgi:hypothetical protein